MATNKKTEKEDVLAQYDSAYLSKYAKEQMKGLYDSMPNESADLEVHMEYKARTIEVKNEINKIAKFVNRQFVIANTQLMKARIREHHTNKQISMFDFGINDKEESEE